MKYGDIITLGRHILMCGDATKRDDVYELVGNEHIDLVLTDPPYGINIQNGRSYIGHKNPRKTAFFNNAETRTLRYPQLIGDNSSQSAKLNYEIVKEFTNKLIIWGGNYFTDFLPVSGGWIFWDKKRRGMDFSDGELAYRSWGKKLTFHFCRCANQKKCLNKIQTFPQNLTYETTLSREYYTRKTDKLCLKRAVPMSD